MKVGRSTILVALGLSSLIWVFFYYATPEAPLNGRDTAVIVGVSLGVVIVARSICSYLGRTLGRMWRFARRRVRGNALLVVLCAVGVANAQGAAGPPTPEPFVISCTPDKPLARAGERLRLRVWMSEDDAARRYSWSVDGGRLEGDGREVVWDFGGAEPGYYAATVQVTARTGESAECSLQVVVPPSEGKRGFDTGRVFLAPDQNEVAGFGLYSYLLLGSPPHDTASRARYLRVIEGYLAIVLEAEELLRFFEPRELNVTYVPVMRGPDSTVAAEWVLEHYDYARARRILRAFPQQARDRGPYLASVQVRPDHDAPRDGPYVYQDLSHVPPDVVAEWIRLFVNQAAQERVWEEQRMRQFVLKLRGAVSILAESVPDIVEGVKTWIAFVR